MKELATHIQIAHILSLEMQQLSDYDYYLNVERHIGDGACAIVQVHGKVIKTNLLLQELSQVVLEKIATCTLLKKLWNGKEPRHSRRLF